MTGNIDIKGARANNLKSVDLSLPRGEFIVVTGVSGSGKSSLAFDTLYAEGRRRYVESLSAYARQFLGRIPKPECDYIKGLPPAIAIEQSTGSRNPRSTVGTATEIYDYLRMLFARVGHTYSPVSGREVKKESVDNIVENLVNYETGTRLAVLAPIILPEGRTLGEQLSIYLKEGYSRVEHKGEFVEIADILNENIPAHPAYYRLVIDRLSISKEKDNISRLSDSLETAYFEGHGECIIKIWDEQQPHELFFSRQFAADGMVLREPSDLMFNFNNPYGACECCEGFGSVLGISEDLVVPDKNLTLYQGAVKCFGGDKMSEWQNLMVNVAENIGLPIHIPYRKLSDHQKQILWNGSSPLWPGIDEFFKWVDTQQYKIQYRVLKARYRGKTVCPVCHGTRLRPDVEYVKIGGKSITQLLDMPVAGLADYFANLQLPQENAAIAKRLLEEIKNRLTYLNDVGLGYLTLSRGWNTLSGGEGQRIKLATSLGSSLVGSLYVLDEPSIGLHPRDTQRLIGVLKKLRDGGNTLVVVEHDEEIMKAADRIVDIGPGAGSLGGRIVYNGSIKNIRDFSTMANEAPASRTLAFLSKKEEIAVPRQRRQWKKYVEVQEASENNLKNINVKFPLGVLTVVTGVSGSGKSTLVSNILYRSLMDKLNTPTTDKPGLHKGLEGDIKGIDRVEYVDQKPIGTSTRSNAATYLKIYDDIRRLYADQPLSVQMGYTPSYFSFNTDGGRCEECKGEGVITIPMQFMADIQVPCEVCGGKRFKREILDVKYRGKDISDILEMTVAEASAFFGEDVETPLANTITRKLQPLLDVGLGYLPLGQSSSTLSGGENQRLKLAYFLSDRSKDKIMFILDEPTTGLHTADISLLLESLNRLINQGNTVIVIEHNLHVAKTADWIVDLGPEGGEAGGYLVAEGTPEQIAANQQSITGSYLKSEL